MHSPILMGCLFALIADSKAIQHSKRYDIDCNGTPDWCYVDGATAHCMRGDGSWTSFPAATSIVCPIAKTTTSTGTTTLTVTTTAAVKITPLAIIRSSSTLSLAASTASESSYGTLSSPADFKADKGKKWKIELRDNLSYTGSFGVKNVNSDKGRTSKTGNKIIWNFGDMQCSDDWAVCGFSMGPAFYGTDNVMTVDTSKVDLVQKHDFVQAWFDDSPPQAPHWTWGMDTSNVAEINSTRGVAFAWETWRGASNGSVVDCGNAVASITLGADKSIAQRVGPLLTGPTSIALGLLAILRDGKYIHTYSEGGPSNIIIGRVIADDSVFDATKHEFLRYSTSNTWSPGIPTRNDNSFGATTANPGGRFGCAVYGSVFYNSCLEKYVILCNIYLSFVDMYTSDTPYGPWSAEYGITSSGNDGLLPGSYGAHARPEYGDGKERYFSIGPNTVFQVFKVSFDY